jgi:hypothetical protein
MVFDYQAARLVVGIIAFTLPFAVRFIYGKQLSSISDYYYTDARDVLVGMLFIVGSFLFAYNGHDTCQCIASKIASLAAILAALCPTKCCGCDENFISIIHYCSATTLFLILTYFCLGPFSAGAKGKEKREEKGIVKINEKAKLRRFIYQRCGHIMIVCMAIMILNAVLAIVFKIDLETLRITYWGELVSLVAFGTAWMTASKAFRVVANEDEVLFKRKKLKVGS